MALRFNGNSPTGANPWSASVGRTIGTVSGLSVHTSAMPLFARGGSRMACHLTYSDVIGLPLGALHPSSWAMPSKGGVMASRNNVNGSGGITGSPQSGQNIDATLTGSGGIFSAQLGLLVQLLATLTGSGGIVSATPQALATLIATLTGSGGITAGLSGLANLSAQISGQGTITANNTPLATMSATLRGYGDLTPEGIRDSVWQANAASYNGAGTTGQKLNSASSGGVDLNALSDAVWAHVSRTLTQAVPTDAQTASAVRAELTEELLRIIEMAKLQGLVTGSPLVVTPTSRVAGNISQSITGDGTTSTTITRNP